MFPITGGESGRVHQWLRDPAAARGGAEPGARESMERHGKPWGKPWGKPYETHEIWGNLVIETMKYGDFWELNPSNLEKSHRDYGIEPMMEKCGDVANFMEVEVSISHHLRIICG